MKERMVIPKDKIKVLTSCGHFPANGYFTFYKEDVEVEQVPESWEELKELCKGLESVSIHDVGGYIKLSINGDLIYFFIAGEMEGKIDITNNTFLERFCVIQKATPQQMWQIIKSLIGE